MDRPLIYTGALPQTTDLLNLARWSMEGQAWQAQGVLGAGPFITDFTCIPQTVPNLSVQVTPGQIFQSYNLDSTAYSDLPAVTSQQIVKQGIFRTTNTLGCPAPSTSGQSINYLVEIAYTDSDSGPIVLPYYNAANPAVAQSGPSNSGTSQNTVRQGLCTVQVKAGTAATTGTQTTPAPDGGFVGAFVVTVANGQTQILSGNISTYSAAPFISVKLGQVPAWVQSSAYNYAVDAGTANQVNLTLSPAPASINPGFSVRFKKVALTSTGAMTLILNGASPVTLAYADGSAMSSTQTMASGWMAEATYDGTIWRFTNGTSTTATGTLTAASGEGVTVTGSSVALAFPTLAVENTQGATDAWAYYSQADGHHRIIQWSTLLANIKANIPTATTTSNGVARWATTTEATNGVTTGSSPAFMSPENVAAYLAANFGVATTTTRGITRQATLAEAGAGLTSGSAPAFVTPEGLAAFVGSSGPFLTTGIGATVVMGGSYPFGTNPLASVGATASMSYSGGSISPTGGYLTGAQTALYSAVDYRWTAKPAGTWTLVTVSLSTTGPTANGGGGQGTGTIYGVSGYATGTWVRTS